MTTLKTSPAGRDAFVPGHQAVYVPEPGLPLVRGVIATASATRVVFEVDAVLAMFGLPRRSCWTYRKGRGCFQSGRRPAKGERGLMLLRAS